MDEISDYDFKEFVKTVQDLARRAYPNPGRADCPGPQVIHEVARLSRPAAHPVFQSHIVRCSPCIQDVLAERTRIQIAAEEPAASSRRDSGRRLPPRAYFFSADAAAPVRAAPNEMARAGNIPEIPIDLRPFSPTRSASPEKSKPSLTVPNGRVRLKIYLALGSPEGAYEIQVLTNKLQTLRSQQATVVASGGTVSLPVDMDLAGLPVGTYVLALRPANDNEEWQTYPMVLRRAP